ncbi:MAG: S-layer homology domain-containing protein, partial [Clostridiales bacterium]|nr:S-layer homology domain-containing protein [Clostridiales bacterium]
GTYTYQLNLVDMANGEQVLATETISIEVTYPFAFEVNAPKSMRVDQENTNTSVRLYAVDGNDQAYTNALITIQVDGPEGAKPQFIAKDGDTEWNVLDFGYFGPETGFPVTADYDVTTNFAKVSFDKTGTYTVTLALVDKNNQDLVLAESINTISVTNRSSGGSGNATSRYDIEVAQTQNGTVKVSSNRVAEGSTVTITTTPDEGYALTGLKVTDQSSKEVTLTDKGDGVYTFTMPASDVTVKADFAQGSDLPFTDVAVNDWFYSAVRYMYENGCMNGLTDTTFGPDATTTRGMIVTMLYRHENEPTVAGENPFADVESTQYYADAINWAAANNIVTGYDETTFGPEDTITRAQMATILYRYAQYKGYDTTQGGMAVREFADYAEISDWSMTAVTWAVNADLLNGRSDNTLDPNGNATRAEVATILMRFCETFVK